MDTMLKFGIRKKKKKERKEKGEKNKTQFGSREPISTEPQKKTTIIHICTFYIVYRTPY